MLKICPPPSSIKFCIIMVFNRKFGIWYTIQKTLLNMGVGIFLSVFSSEYQLKKLTTLFE